MTRLGRWLSPGVRFEGGAAAWFCARCGYECRSGEAVRCSECGAEIEPSTGRGLRRSAPGALAQALMRAPALPMLACGLMAAAALAWGRSVPGGYFLWQMVAAAALVLLTGLSLLRMLAAGFVSNRRGRLGDCARQRGWWAVPAACIAATAVALSPLPLYVGFWMRRGDLDALPPPAAERGEDGARGDLVVRQVGQVDVAADLEQEAGLGDLDGEPAPVCLRPVADERLQQPRPELDRRLGLPVRVEPHPQASFRALALQGAEPVHVPRRPARRQRIQIAA
ncbi:MAG: hypothetical protein ACKOGJ_06210, partial [Phycisphaerales bacterium]